VVKVAGYFVGESHRLRFNERRGVQLIERCWTGESLTSISCSRNQVSTERLGDDFVKDHRPGNVVGVTASLRCETFPADLEAAIHFYVEVLGF
jgi:hypothetical protein